MKKKSAIAIALVALVALVVLYALFWRETSEQTTVVALPSSEPAETEPVESGAAEGFADISADTVQAALRSLSRPASYSRAVTVSYFWDGGQSSTELYSWVDGDRTKIRIPLDTDYENILVDGSTLYIWYDSVPAASYSGPAGSSLESDGWLRCLSYEDLLELPPTDIFAASYEQYNSESCIYVEYNSGELGYTNCIYVSSSTGLLMYAETYDSTGLIYRMDSGPVDLSTPQEGVFIPPSLEMETAEAGEQSAP